MMYKLMYKRSEIMTLIDTRNTVPEGVETHPQQTPQSANSQQVVSDVSEILNFFCLAGSMQLLQASVFPQRILQGSSKALLTSLSVWRCTKSLSILEGFSKDFKSPFGGLGNLGMLRVPCLPCLPCLLAMCQHLWEKSRSTQVYPGRTGRFVKSMARFVVVITPLLGVVTTHLLVARSMLLEVNPQRISTDQL